MRNQQAHKIHTCMVIVMVHVFYPKLSNYWWFICTSLSLMWVNFNPFYLLFFYLLWIVSRAPPPSSLIQGFTGFKDASVLVFNLQALHSSRSYGTPSSTGRTTHVWHFRNFQPPTTVCTKTGSTTSSSRARIQGKQSRFSYFLFTLSMNSNRIRTYIQLKSQYSSFSEFAEFVNKK